MVALAGLSPSALATILIGVVGGAGTIIGLAFKAGQWRGKHEKNVADRDESIETHADSIDRVEGKLDSVSRKVDSLSSDVETMGTRLEHNTKRIQRQNHTLHDVVLNGDETCSDPHCEWCHDYRAESSPVESSRPGDDPSTGD